MGSSSSAFMFEGILEIVAILLAKELHNKTTEQSHPVEIVTVPTGRASGTLSMEATMHVTSKAVLVCLTLNSSYKYEHIQIINQFR